jgi:hypothetical protein
MSTLLLRHDADHLRVFFIIDAVCFVQGLMRMVEQVYSQPHLTSIVASVSLALIGLRLLCSPEALSAYLPRTSSGRAASMPHSRHPVALPGASPASVGPFPDLFATEIRRSGRPGTVTRLVSDRYAGHQYRVAQLATPGGNESGRPLQGVERSAAPLLDDEQLGVWCSPGQRCSVSRAAAS